MTALPAANYDSSASRSQAEMKTAMDAERDVLSEIIGVSGETSVTLASDTFAIANRQRVFVVDGQGGASDNLSTITATGARTGDVIVIRIANNSHIITVKNATGSSPQINTRSGSDVVMNSTKQMMALKYNGSTWEELWNTADSDFFFRLPGAKAESTLTIASGLVVPTAAFHPIDTESGAGTDDLDGLTTTYMSDGTQCFIRGVNAAHVVTVRNNQSVSGKIMTRDSTNLALDSTDKIVWLQQRAGTWYEIARFGFSSGVNQGICNGRLTLTSGTAVTTANVSGASNLYWTPYKGNQIGLSSGSSWSVINYSETTLALSGMVTNVLYDIFGYSNSGTLTLEKLEWKSVVASNSPTSGSSKTINLNDTTGVVVNDLVTVKDGSSNEVAIVTTVTANTSIVVASLTNSYTTPTVYYNARATALVLQDGVWSKTGALTRRYLGTIRATAATTTEDSDSKRFVWNMDNRVDRFLKAFDTTDSWNYTTAAWRAANGSTTPGTARVDFVRGLAEDLVNAWNMSEINNVGTRAAVGIRVDNVDNNDAIIYGARQNGKCMAQYSGYPGVGYHYLQATEYGTTSTVFYGDDGISAARFQSGLVATVKG
jgi:hypothetical protein